ncbi:ester cyclase [Massilia endophytica]|uniref:ester cyclase n=1 Tax=Massilia endophytica TaxID=2899220 RepID=UPI001E5479ED|nr:ester cyclase [Massilia endophytica]UGQ48696.1 ester cyclase [Massilia endophytica]
MQSNVDIALRFMDEVWARRQPGAVHRFVSPMFTDHAYGDGGANAHVRMAETFNAAFSSSEHKVEQAVEQDGLVILRLCVSAQHTGEFRGRAPRGAAIRVQQYRSFRIRAGLVTDHWALLDTAALLRQIDEAAPPRHGGLG